MEQGFKWKLKDNMDDRQIVEISRKLQRIPTKPISDSNRSHDRCKFSTNKKSELEKLLIWQAIVRLTRIGALGNRPAYGPGMPRYTLSHITSANVLKIY